GDAIMNHIVDHIGWVRMRSRSRGFRTTALVDGDVDDRRAGLHRLHYRGRDQLRSRRARYQDGADYQIGAFANCFDRVAGRKYGAPAPAQLIGDAPRRTRMAVDDRDGRAQAGADDSRMRAGTPTAEDCDISRRYAWHAAEQHAAPAVHLFETV